MITVFTPTYNREYKLPQLYNSLICQTNKDFEWIIVDDGSTDNTESLVASWINENKIKIRYYKQENQGKQIAHNKGVLESKGELFICVDSDDYLKEMAIEIIEKSWNNHRGNTNCVGMVAAKILKNNETVGTDMPKNVNYSTLQDLYYKYKHKGDTALIYRCEIIKKYQFPKINGEKFIPETYLYNQIDQDGKLAIIYDKFYVCEYLEDGYTSNSAKLIKNNPIGYILSAEIAKKYANTFKAKIKATARIVLGNWLANKKGYFKSSDEKIMIILATPLAFIIYLKKYRKLQ